MSKFSFGSTNLRFWLVAIALLSYLGAVEVTSARQESATGDEPIELAAGYSYLKTGDFRMNPEHPPLAKIIAALPLLRIHLFFPPDQTSWSKPDEYSFGMEFFTTNAKKEDALLFAGRCSSIVFTLCLGIAIVLWTRAYFNPTIALLALTLYVFDPNITAHGHYVKNDVAITLFSFLACVSWGAFLTRPSTKRLLLAGLCLGLAMATKFSALFLLPVFAILCVIRYWQDRKSFSLGRALLSLAAVFLVCSAVVFLVYALPAFVHGEKLGYVDFDTVQKLFDRSPLGAYTRVGVPGVHPFFKGLLLALDHNTLGHKAYLFGKISVLGWWYYFPVAFAVKTPVATLFFLALAGWAFLAKLRGTKLRSVSFSWFVLAVPIAIFCAFLLDNHIDIGIRHILPMWPFLFILSAALFTRARFRHQRLILVLLGAGLVAESASIYPHYLAFFNVLAGGPANGPKILADSNIDWGQDAKGLAAWLHEHKVSKLCLDYWGNAAIHRLGVTGSGLMETFERTRVAPDCVAAISVNFLYGHSPERGDFSWLRNVPPDARIGYSIYVYDLPKRIPAVPFPIPVGPGR